MMCFIVLFIENFYYLITNPPLAYPAIVLERPAPVSVIEKTIISRLPAVTGMLNPVVWPETTVPTPTNSSKGLKLTSAPGIGINKLSEPEMLEYNSAVIDKVPGGKKRATVVENTTERSVMILSRGTTKAIFQGLPAAPLKSI